MHCSLGALTAQDGKNTISIKHSRLFSPRLDKKRQTWEVALVHGRPAPCMGTCRRLEPAWLLSPTQQRAAHRRSCALKPQRSKTKPRWPVVNLIPFIATASIPTVPPPCIHSPSPQTTSQAPDKQGRAGIEREGLLVTRDDEELESGPLRLKVKVEN